MTKTIYAAFFINIWLIWAAFGQESPTPTSSPDQNAAPTASAWPTPSQSESRRVRIRFVPPPMEGTISLGLFDSNRKLVRVLHREAKIDDFTIEADSLSTTWDGKDSTGEDLPPGRYHARGYLVGQVKVDELGPTKASIPTDLTDHISVKLVTNPLLNDVRSVVDLGVGFDERGSFLKSMDNLPLHSISTTPNLIRASITKNGEKSADVWLDNGATIDQFRLSNIDQMMAFDCGDFELK